MVLVLLKRWFKGMRDGAVRDYLQCTEEMLEPAAHSPRLLDCGCDDGARTVQLAARLGSAELHGIEIVAERRVLAEERGVKAVPGDLNETFPYDDDQFDVVHANQVIEHLADTDNFIEQIHRVLKPGGYAVICTENLASWHNIVSLALGWQPFSLANVCEKRFQVGNPLAIHDGEQAVMPKSWLHMRVFAYRGLRAVFEEHGFEVEECVGSGYYPLPNLFSKLDPRHAAFLTLKVRKRTAP